MPLFISLGVHKRAPLVKKHAWYGTILIIVPLALGACTSDETSTQQAPIGSQSTNRSEQTKSDIEDKIINSYARVASEQPHICPKLVQKKVDNAVIKRAAEVMINDSCDYFLYPKKGEQISVRLSTDQIEALLITPKTYNFANGPYSVHSYDKHVIRLSYNGASYKPEYFLYDVAIIIDK